MNTGVSDRRTVAVDTVVFKSPGPPSELPTVSGVGRKVDVEQLVGSAEIAERLGVARHQVVHSWRRRYEDFPKPVVTLKQAMLWNWPDVEAWARKTNRL